MSQALYRKWRPRKWDEIVGQPHIVLTLKNALRSNHIAHAYLFAGPRGTGKTTAARLLAKAVNCLGDETTEKPCNSCENCLAVNENRFLDLIEIDAASENSVDGVRELRDKINFTPNVGRYKIYIIDEVHMFSNSAFNALLKTLEEPPPHAIFILATTEIHKIPPTVLSRCQRHEFRRLPVDVIVTQLENIVKQEGLQAEPEALTMIARQSAGGLRDAISLLDQLSSTGKLINLELVQAILGTANNQTVLSLVEAILKGEPGKGMDAIHTSLDSGTDARALARQVVDYLRALLLIQMDNNAQVDLAGDVRVEAVKHARQFTPGDILRLIKLFNTAASDQRGGWQPGLPLEMAFTEALDEAVKELKYPPPTESKPVAEPVKKIRENNPAIGKPAPIIAGTPAIPNSDTGVTLAGVIKSWKKISASVRDNLPLNALLNSCKVLDLKEKTLTLGFTSEILRTKVNTPENVETICKAIKESLGVDLGVKCIVSNAKQSTPPDIKADGMVAAALKAGGEIVDMHD